MSIFRQDKLIFPLSVTLSLFLMSCANTKVYQCNEIISIANNAVTEAKDLTQEGQTTDPQAMLQAADAMEQASEEMKVIAVEDEQLRNYQTGFINMYQNTAQATREFVKAYEKSNRDEAEVALTNLQEATGSEEGLVRSINDYCSQTN